MATHSPGQPSTEATQVKLPPFPQGMKRRWLWVLHAFRTLAAAMGITLSFGIEGAKRIQRRPDGGYDVFGLADATASEDIWSNFQPYDVTAEECKISAGTLATQQSGTHVPTIAGTAINVSTPPTLTLSATGVNYVYLVVKNITLVSTTDSYVRSYTVASPSTNIVVEKYDTVQQSTATQVVIPLFNVQEGVVTSRIRYNNAALRAEDNGNANNTPFWITW